LLIKRPLRPDGRGPWIELIGKAGGPDALKHLLDVMAGNQFDDKTALRGLSALSDAMRLRNRKPAADLEKLNPLLSRSDERVRAATVRLAGAWRLETWTPRLCAMAMDLKSALSCRAACLDALRSLRGPAAVSALKAVATNGDDVPALRRQALFALASFEPEIALPLIRDAITKEEGSGAEEL